MIPHVGFGTARLRADACQRAVAAAINAGCRHIDCAKFYGNELYVGKAITAAVNSGAVARSDLFITSKCWNDDHRPEDLVQACRKTLQDLGVEYLDLYLMHWPVAWAKGTLGCPDFGVTIEQTWRAMETLVDQGLVRSLGVSNFGPQRLDSLLASARIRPIANQLELHPLLAQRKLVQYCHDRGVRCVAWSPLAKFSSALTDHPVVNGIAKAHKTTPCQVILRWNVQRGVAVIPRSSSPAHIAENLQVASMKLTEEEMLAMYGLDRHERVTRDWVGVFEETPIFPYHLFGYLGMLLGWCFWLVVPHVFDFKNPQLSLLDVVATDRRISASDCLRLLFLLVMLARWVGMI